jgi:hypothetical protein
MSKNRKPEDGRRGEQPPAMPGFIRGALSEIMAAVRDHESPFIEQDLPPCVCESVTEWTEDMLRFCRTRRESLGDLDRRQWTEIGAMVMYAAEAGFAMALYRYAEELKQVPELTAWQKKRVAGGDKGRQTAAEKRRRRAQHIRDTWRRMEAAGENPTNEKVADAEGCSVSTVIRAFKPA